MQKQTPQPNNPARARAQKSAPHLPPQNIEAEEAILGAMMMSSRAVESAFDVGLKTTDFYKPQHQEIFDVIVDLSNKGQVDEHLVANELQRRGHLDDIGGRVALMGLAERVPAIANARAYAREVIDQATLRGLVEVGHEISTLGYEHSDEPTLLVDQAGVIVNELAQKRELSDFVQLPDLLGPIFDQLTERAEAGGAPSGLQSHFVDLDKVTGGFQKSNLVILAARPAMGKTAFALNLAEQVAMRDRKAVAIFSLEMDQDDLAMRIMSSVAKVDSKKLRHGVPGDEDWPHLVDAVGRMSSAMDLIFIDQSAMLTPMQLRTKSRRLHNRLKGSGGLGLIIIDYLQLMETGLRRSENRQVDIAFISRQLKSLARELQVPIIALSQLSRAVESRPDKRPMLSDLRESGAIEQDADLVMFLYRPEYYGDDREEFKGKAELIIAKNRHGETNSVWLGFQPMYTRFVNIQRSDFPSRPGWNSQSQQQNGQGQQQNGDYRGDSSNVV